MSELFYNICKCTFISLLRYSQMRRRGNNMMRTERMDSKKDMVVHTMIYFQGELDNVK